MDTSTTTPIAPGATIRYKRDGKFRVLAHVDGDRWEVEGLAGKFGGKTRTVTLGADTVVIEPAPAPVPAPAVEAPAPTVDDAPTATAPTEAQGSHTRDECEDLDACTADHVTAPAPRRARKARAATPARTPLPEGWVTPYGLAEAINARGLYHGSRAAMPGKGVYARALRAPASNPFPGKKIDGRLAVELEAGLAWWKRAHPAAGHASAAEAS